MRRVTNGRILHFAGAALLAGGVAAASDSPPAETQPGLEWSYEMQNETYTKYSVSIGDGGSQVFTDTGRTNRITRLFSALDTGSSTAPEWEANQSGYTYNQLVASADTVDRHYSLVQVNDPAGSINRFAVLEAFSSASGQPLWSYPFPTPIINHDRMMMECSADGQVVAVVIANVMTGAEEVWIFRNGSQHSPIHFQGGMSGWFRYGRLSRDGSTLYLNSESRLKIFDTASGTELHSQAVFGGTYTGHAISGDGRTVAFSNGYGATVLRRNSAGNYVQHTTVSGQSGEYVNTISLDRDGDTLSIGSSNASTNQARLRVLSLSSGTTTLMDRTYQAQGSASHWPWDTELSESGDRVAFSLTGDGTTSSNTPEVCVFQRANAGDSESAFGPFASWHVDGSRMELDLSADGTRLVVCGRNSHISAATGVKVIELYHLGADLVLEGSPQVGGSMHVSYVPESYPNAWLIVTRDRFQNPISTPAGSLWLDRQQGLQVVALNHADDSGVARGTFPILSSYSPGTQLYVQAYSAGPQRILSKTMQSLTVLP